MAEGTRRKSTTATKPNYLDPPLASFSDSSEDDFERDGDSTGGRGSEDDDEESDAEGSDFEWGSKTAGKKQKRRRGGVKGEGKGKSKADKAPKQDLLKTMPMDLLFEILSYLRPGELLSVTRLSKAYLDLLTSKNATSIWRASRRLLGMPDLTAKKRSEIAYAGLVFGKKCESCNGAQEGIPEHHLGVRLCVSCKKKQLVKFTKSLFKSRPDLHPAIKQVVLTTPYSPTEPYWTSRNNHWALSSDLDWYSKVLTELQQEDDAEAEVAPKKRASASAATTVGGRSRARTTSVVEQDEDESDEEQQSCSFRVGEFIESRKEDLEQAAQDGETLAKLHKNLKAKEKEDASDFWSNVRGPLHTAVDALKNPQKRTDNRARQAREDALLERIDLEDDDYDVPWRLRRSPLWRNSPFVKSTQPLTDDDWEEIKDDVLELVDQVRQALADEEAKRAEEWRIEREWRSLRSLRDESLKKRYLHLRASQKDDVNKALFPLGTDFLLFESVEPLLLSQQLAEGYTGTKDNGDRARVSDEEWALALPLINEELSTYRLELVLHAIKLILTATTEGDLPEDDEILDNIDEYDQSFFSAATSFLCCYFYGCGQARTWRWGHPPPAGLFVGELVDVLRHQHAEHAQFYNYRGTKVQLPTFRFSLPPEVACAMSAVHDLGDLDEGTATREHLDDLDKRARFKWVNKFKGKVFDGWKALLESVKVDADVAARQSRDLDLARDRPRRPPLEGQAWRVRR